MVVAFCRKWVVIVVLLLMSAACDRSHKPAVVNPLGISEADSSEHYDLPEIQSSGILIAATISGPDTYFDFRGRPMGLQYALAENFAVSHGLEVRMEVAHDTTELLQWLKDKKVDIVTLPLPDSLAQANDLESAGVKSPSGRWVLRKDVPELTAALDSWYSDSLLSVVTRSENTKIQQKSFVRRHVNAPYISQSKGLISHYDHLFKEAAQKTGFDWRLIAALCYQESAFDPEAVSWAGARGLMQIMPGTAKEIGLAQSDMHNPRASVMAGAGYLKSLSDRFADVRDRNERIKFAMAAYNGGYWHIRDAMALAQKHGKNNLRWDEVAPFVLGLSRPEYYRDPVVKYGYMIGSETHNYVYSILERWRRYGGTVAVGNRHGVVTSGSYAPPAKKKRNRFTQKNVIVRPDDSGFGEELTKK